MKRKKTHLIAIAIAALAIILFGFYENSYKTVNDILNDADPGEIARVSVVVSKEYDSAVLFENRLAAFRSFPAATYTITTKSIELLPLPM